MSTHDTGGPAIYVIVCANDKPHPKYGVDERGALVHETYVADATLEVQQKHAAVLERFGACRIGRVVFEDVDGSPL